MKMKGSRVVSCRKLKQMHQKIKIPPVIFALSLFLCLAPNYPLPLTAFLTHKHTAIFSFCCRQTGNPTGALLMMSSSLRACVRVSKAHLTGSFSSQHSLLILPRPRPFTSTVTLSYRNSLWQYQVIHKKVIVIRRYGTKYPSTIQEDIFYIII